MKRNLKFNRRKFIHSMVVSIGMPLIVPNSVLGLGGHTSPSNRITLGCIGAGGKGRHGMNMFIQHADLQIVAVCDVRLNSRQNAAAFVDKYYAGVHQKDSYNGCAIVDDFRQITSRADIDAVLVATPDHWHVPIAIEAIKSGKDIYCEKPLGRTVTEGQALVKAVQRYGRVFQHGTQLRSLRDVRFACELVRNGRIGRLHTVRIGTPGGEATGPRTPLPVPSGFDYEMWLGPAPWASYCQDRCTAPGWYFISDYSPSGFMAGYAVHDIDIALWGMGKLFSGPIQVEGLAVYPKEGIWDTAITHHVEYRFASGIKLVLATLNENPHGVRFEGSEGWVFTRSGIESEPKSLLSSAIGPSEIHLYASSEHERNFLDCVKSRALTICPADAAHRATTLSHIGDIACRIGRRLTWDDQKECFINDDEANRMLIRTMRQPWSI